MFKPKTLELSPERKKYVAVGILTDAVMLERAYYAINTLNKVSGAQDRETDWTAMDQASSYCSIYHLLGISGDLEDEDLGNKVANIFNSFKSELDTNFTKPARVVSEQMYVEMVAAVTDYNRKAFLTKSKK